MDCGAGRARHHARHRRRPGGRAAAGDGDRDSAAERARGQGLEGGDTTLSIAWQATQLIATDLRSTSELYPVGPDQKDFYSYPEVTAPSFPRWRSKGVKALVTGFVQARIGRPADRRLLCL